MRMLGVLLASALAALAPTAFGAEHPCEKLVGLLATDFVYRIANSELARVEIRQCSPADSGTIQLVAWSAGSATPALLVNTDDFGVVQTVARANVFIIETGGATRDQVFVIIYNRGQPRVALRQITRGSAHIKVDAAVINVDVDGIYAGDSPPRAESRRFDLDPGGTKPK
jgi:hypothetical protein